MQPQVQLCTDIHHYHCIITKPFYLMNLKIFFSIMSIISPFSVCIVLWCTQRYHIINVISMANWEERQKSNQDIGCFYFGASFNFPSQLIKLMQPEVQWEIVYWYLSLSLHHHKTCLSDESESILFNHFSVL